MQKWFEIYSSILYMHFSGNFLALPDSAKSAVSPQKPLMRLLRMAGYTVVRLLGNLLKVVEKPEKLQGKVWLYVVSQNNYDSLKFISEELQNVSFVAGQSKELGKYNPFVNRLSLRKKLLYYYKFLPLLFLFLKYKKASTLRFFDLLYDSVGFYEIYLQKLHKYKPAAIVFANDHNADARAMLLAAKASGIKTIYLQHASVSPIFPPLAFDLNLLEGHDALTKYKLCGPIAGKVELIGMPKADAFVGKRNFSTSIKTVGLGCNLLDDVKEVQRVLQRISSAFPAISFILRPHPRDTRNIAALAAMADNIILSDSRSQSAFEYLQQLDVQISGNSAIHLEAVMLNIWSIFYEFNPTQPLPDYYGFIGNKLVDVATSPDHLVSMLESRLQERPRVVEQAQYYNATVCTANEGKSAALALAHIKDYIRQ
ncbi:hypothetical protein [Pontibacter rugosus]|uniref:Uncharacterized protein n=1 Tax=Pontibacter rugosus TaxID=1745966 RepID=A0ABW3SQM6_9BACT